MSDTNIYHLPCRKDFSNANAVENTASASCQFTEDEEATLGNIGKSYGGTFRKTDMPVGEGERIEFFMNAFESSFHAPSLIVQKEPWSASTIGFRLVMVKENQVPESNNFDTICKHLRGYLQSAQANAQPQLKAVQ